jgi:acyl-homoserine-lactone acylase
MKKFCAVAMLCCIASAVFAQTEQSGEFEIDPSQINIVRDNYGVPHIFAKTDAEVAYGLAWAHSEDDFQTLQKTLLASKSMLGLYTGRDGATIDYVVHLLRIRELIDEKYETDISETFKKVLRGYCEGLNAFARTHPKEVLIKRAFPATPQDLIAYSVLQLAVGCGVETELKKIFHGTVPTVIGQEPEGSNAFAFNSKCTKDGNVYLAINTHHPLEGQVAWYEAHLSSEEGWNIIGSVFPGAPVIFTGVNNHLAWTHTVNHPDKVDVYQLEMNPENDLQYNVDGLWYTLEESTVKLKVKVPGFNLHVKKKVYNSIYGPTVVTDRGVFSVRTGGIMDIRGLEEWYWMNKATSFHEFKSALKMEAHPSYNIVYGDRYDTIYYISNGKIPVREPGYNWSGTLPGNTSHTRWTKFHPIEELPQLLNPTSGYVYNVNHAPFKASAEADNLCPENFDPNMGYETFDNNRSLRVKELMEQYTNQNDGDCKISYEDFKRMKYDVQLPKQLAFPVDIDALFSLNEKQHPDIASLITTLKKWDRKGTTDSHGAAIFGIFFYYVAAKYERDPNFKLMTADMCAEALVYVKDYILKNFGTTHITLGEYQRLERGERSLPLAGLPDVLAAMYSTPTENGRVKGTVGECYIALIKFTPDGPEIETVNAYGASNRPGNKHYDDQMELFQKQQTKKMTLSAEEIYANAKTVYHPEIFSRLPRTAKLTRGRR